VIWAQLPPQFGRPFRLAESDFGASRRLHHLEAGLAQLGDCSHLGGGFKEDVRFVSGKAMAAKRRRKH